jgi:tripartite-type tricarboxylate transporter receptor subunit TctC
MTGVNIVHIAYKGTAPGMTSVLSGETQMIMVDVGFAAPHVKSGRMRALGVSSLDPSLLMPGVPTIAASGVPGYEYVNATGAWAPIKTPRALVTRLNQEIVRYVQRPDVKEKMLAAGIEPVGDKPEQFDVFIKDSIAKSSKVIKDAGIKAE